MINKIIIIICNSKIKNNPASNINETPAIKVLFTAIDRDENLLLNLLEFLDAYDVKIYRIQ